MLGTVTPLSFRQALHEWFAVALAELRSVRRLARTWMFLGLGIAVMGTTYAYYSYLHATSTFSTGDASRAATPSSGSVRPAESLRSAMSP